ncbi:hypothetical protein [Adlercreutzia equolifaciens]|mgnify:CR=1 FL=1|uniref:hypothetical protein n=1 Tax=Adlercreutzia equolifaciens TaxID=446660 RepID=UPI0026DB0CD1|nr:hypothetical protein [Adlercreutzia equolifaciens]
MDKGRCRIYYRAGIDPPGKRVQKSKNIYDTRDEAEIALAHQRIGDYRTQRLDIWSAFWNCVVAPSREDLARRPDTVAIAHRTWSRSRARQPQYTKYQDSDRKKD